MPAICSIYFQDHNLHPIIVRQIASFIGSGYSVHIIDQSEKSQNQYTYQHLKVDCVKLSFFRTWVWKFFRLITPEKLGELYWTILVCTENTLTSIKFAQVISKSHPDIYQAHDLWALLAAGIACTILKRPIIFDAHEIEPEIGDPQAKYNRYIRWMETKLIRNVDLLIVPNHARADYYSQTGLLKSPPLVIHNYPPFQTYIRTNLIRETLFLPENVRIVLYHGALIPYRSLEELLRASVYFEKDIMLVIIGNLEHEYFRNVLLPIWERESNHEMVSFLPYIPQAAIMPWVTSADLGIVIYKNVNLNNFLCAPTKLYEYILAGVPVAICNFPELEKFMAETPVGVTFNPDEAKQIAEAINEFFSYPESKLVEIRKTMHQASLRNTWEQESEKLVKKVETLIKKGNA